ncbi:polymorphic toxin-type HINT domain-containing protein, partial [Sinomonas mesophila]|uniref:polymorphic toxin-type HINT domain-containing protein n=1 Tax=Sinomonas mesophila TaxID=1531955 RepID=UPI001C375AA1
PLRYLDITGLFSWDEFLGGVQDVSGIVSDVAGVLAIAAAVTGVGAPVAAALGVISIAAGAVEAGTKAIQAYNTCNGGKGSCGEAVAEALLSTAAIVPGGRLIKGAASAAKTMAKACSFSGTTVVLMGDGSRKPIEDVNVGDKVIASDPETGEQEAKTVERRFVHDDTVIDLAVEGEPITTTEDHPFWSVTDQRFERADQLEPGEEVLGADGRTIRVSGLDLGTRRQSLAYNLSVEGIHTYHIGEQGILVHNTCATGLGNSSGIYAVNSPKGVYVGQSNDILRRLAEHVRSGKFTAADAAAAAIQPVSGGKTQREIAEQMMIDRLGGVPNLLNKVNPIGPKRFGQMPIQPYTR